MRLRRRYKPTTGKEKRIDELMTRWLWATSEEAKTIENEIYLIVEGLYTVEERPKKERPKKKWHIKRTTLKAIGILGTTILIGVLALTLTLTHLRIMENFSGAGKVPKVTTIKIEKLKGDKLEFIAEQARGTLKEKYPNVTTIETDTSYPGPCGKMDCELAKTIFICKIHNNDKTISIGSSTVLTRKAYLGRSSAFLNAFTRLNLSLPDYELIAETNS